MENLDFTKSNALLQRALEVIPGGTQTFSKSITQFPRNISPYYVDRGEGATLWDVDGNRYTDYISGLHAILLGYQDPDVNAAVRDQFECGLTFSLPTSLEIEVAEEICRLVPSAEKVRFGKNGSDATAGAVRAARGFTGKDRVAVCGYHGWQDWYIGTTSRNLGVPKDVSNLTDVFQYNDIQSLKDLFAKHPGEYAAVVMEPMNMTDPAPGFLEAVRGLTREQGVVLIFDEMITGFRFDVGGAQAAFGVTPDLTTLGKGVANGYPLSAIAGRADIMDVLAESFFSFTMGSEALSLAAAKAVMKKMTDEPVLEHIHTTGRYLIEQLNQCIARHGISDWLSISGHPTWTFLQFKDAGAYSVWDLRTFFMQETIQRGVLCLGTHNLNYAHTQKDIDGLISVYNVVFDQMKDGIENNTLIDSLRCETLVPLFKVR